MVLLEDEVAFREEVASFLTDRGHRVSQAGSLADFRVALEQTDIGVLDVMLPDGDGFEAMARLREVSPRAGIIMLTARGSVEDRLHGLQGGADHYLVKPFRLVELAAIIDALDRRVGRHWRLETVGVQLIDPEGHALGLTGGELGLLRTLAEAPQQTATRRRIVEAMGYDWLEYDNRRLDTLVSRLRARWRQHTGSELPLRTRYADGYTFGALLERV